MNNEAPKAAPNDEDRTEWPRIFKFPIDVVGEQRIRMPSGAQFLSAQEQYGLICSWWLVHPTEEIVDHVVHVVGTGRAIEPELAMQFADGMFLATVQQSGGALVWHIFDGGEIQGEPA
jgi:hypothetical protein